MQIASEIRFFSFIASSSEAAAQTPLSFFVAGAVHIPAFATAFYSVSPSFFFLIRVSNLRQIFIHRQRHRHS